MAPDFRRVDFGLFRDQLGRVSWAAFLERKQVQESWLIFKESGSLSSRIVYLGMQAVTQN